MKKSSDKLILLGYTKEALDAEYDNRVKVPDAEDYFDFYIKESASARKELPCKLDISYGPTTREKLDVFPASERHQPAPVLIFIHGGYWRAFSKNESSFVARGFVSAGVAVVLIGYTLIPNVNMDELVEQCRKAVAWTWRNADSFGGDQNRIYVSGHSAGGHLTGMMMATDWEVWDGLPSDIIKGGCGISGIYDLEPIRLCYLNEDLKLTPGEVDRNSPVRIVPKCPAKLLLAVGGLEGPEYLRQSQEMASAWRDQGCDAEVLIMRDIHHFSIITQFKNQNEELTRSILELVEIKQSR